IRSHASPAQRTGSPLVPAARHQGRGAPCGESFWHWALGADGGHGHAQPPFRSSRLIGAERQPTSDCRQSLQQSLNSCPCWPNSVLYECPDNAFDIGVEVFWMASSFTFLVNVDDHD